MLKDWHIDSNGDTVLYDSIEKFPPKCVGFVYKIKNIETEKFYIGKKSIFSNIKKRLTKKELAEHTGPGKKPVKKLVTKESNWKEYWGSNKVLLEEIKQNGVEKFQRQILVFCYSKKQLGYWEIYYQCVEQVLLTDKSYNDNIASKYFRRDLIL